MRTSTFKKGWITSDEGELIGLSLGYDFVAEHEWGIETLQHEFGIDTSHHGIKGRQITRVPSFYWEDDGQEALFLCQSRTIDQYDEQWVEYVKGYVWFSEWKDVNEVDRSLACAWSGRDFGIRARGSSRANLIQIKNALARTDLAMTVASGLQLLIVSRFPADKNREWIATDKERIRLAHLWNESGVEKELRDAGKRWFFLRNPRENEEGLLRLWLNPREQDIHRAGWYSLDELRAWANDTGPVMRE